MKFLKMEIEISSVILGACFLAVFFVPIIYSQRKHKSSQKNILARFLEAAASHQLSITQYDILGEHGAIGLDTGAKMMFFYQQSPSGTDRILVDLRDVKSCKMINVSRDLKVRKGTVTVVDRIRLRLIFRNGVIPEKELLFYEGTTGAPLADEFYQAKKWVQIIQSNLKLPVRLYTPAHRQVTKKTRVV